MEYRIDKQIFADGHTAYIIRKLVPEHWTWHGGPYNSSEEAHRHLLITTEEGKVIHGD